MKIKCDYCGNIYEELQKQCPACRAPNLSHHDGDRQPHTIEELKRWYEDRHLPPPEITRFFIGIDYQDPKAFGIYKDEISGDYIVYKNRADGNRVIRYRGKDEAYAVDELYQKLKDEIVHQKNNSRVRNQTTSAQVNHNNIRFQRIKTAIVIACFCMIWNLIVFTTTYMNSRHNGYYSYPDSYTNETVIYYKDGSTWYAYNDYGDTWYETTTPKYYNKDNTDPYYMGKSYSDASEWDNSVSFSDATESTTYMENHLESDYDHDFDWDSGSDWDTGGTDWDSDW